MQFGNSVVWMGKAILLVAVTMTPIGSTADAAQTSGGRVINVPGSTTSVRIWDAAGETPAYSVSFDGVTFTEPKSTSYDLLLLHGAFDPLEPQLGDAPMIAPELAAADDIDLYIVQFMTQPLEAYRNVIRDLGGEVYTFLANHSHIVHMNPEVRAEVEALPFVRWVGAFHPVYRLEPWLVENAAQAEFVYPLLQYNILVFEPDMKQTVGDSIAALGGQVDRVNAGKRIVEATLTPAELFAAARLDEVAFIDRWSDFEADMDQVREVGGANYIETVEGFTGQGVRGEVFDLGFNIDHVDFESNPLIPHNEIDDASHGAATSGIVFGDGTGNPQARGLLPDGQGYVAASSGIISGQSRYELTSELVESPIFAVFQTSSVGSSTTTIYNTISAEMDEMLFDFDVVFTQSQSNTGNEFSRPQAWAKNIIAVGGVRSQNTMTDDDDCHCGFASHGPASDGRVKPDVTFFNHDVFTVEGGPPTAYDDFGGTSAATPIVGGHIGLIFQMWSEGVFGNEVDPGATVFDNRCHMTTAKALLINSAMQYDWIDGSAANEDLERGKQGWGRPNLQTLYDQRETMFIVDQDVVMPNLDSVTFDVEVEEGQGALKITMAYPDPAGAPFSTQHRINDLTLRATSPRGAVYWGNFGLFDALWSSPDGSPNTVDTVENIFIEDPDAGTWTIEVIASEVNQDGHVATGGVDAVFSLVVSGASGSLPGLLVNLPDGAPSFVLPGEAPVIPVTITELTESVVPGSETLHVRYASEDPFLELPLTLEEGGSYVANIPAPTCGDEVEFFFSAEGSSGSQFTNPFSAPNVSYHIGVGEFMVGFTDDFSTDLGWTVESDAADGFWERAIPNPDPECDRGNPLEDADGSGWCYVTGNHEMAISCNEDVDEGTTTLISPNLDASNPESAISYDRWYFNIDGSSIDDTYYIDVSDDGGETWTNLETLVPFTPGVVGGWIHKEFVVADIPGIENTETFRIRFVASDLKDGSIVEAAVDAVSIIHLVCEETTVPGDLDADGDVDFADLLAMLDAWGDCPPAGKCPADLDGSGDVGFNDLLTLLANWS